MQKASVWRAALLVTGVVVVVLMGACARTEEAIVQRNRVAESEAAAQPPFKPVASVCAGSAGIGERPFSVS